MAHIPEDGPLGIEGRHQFRGGDQMPPGANNEFGVFMYGHHRPDLGNAWIKIDKVIGLHSLGDGDDFRSPSQGRLGEVIYPGAQRGKTMVYEGRVVGKTLVEMRQQAKLLRRAAAESRERMAGSITIVDPLATGAGYATLVRCLQLDMDEEQLYNSNRIPSPWMRKFILGVRAHDPRFIWYPQNSSLANAIGSTATLENKGIAPADLTFDVTAGGGGHTGAVVIENLTLGVRLQFLSSLVIGAGNVLHIDWNQRSITTPDVVTGPPTYSPNSDMMPHLDIAQSDWWGPMEWGLGPGNNNIRVTAPGGGMANWSVWWHHSSY